VKRDPAPPADTPAARQGSAWLRYFSDSPDETFRAFVRERFPSRADRLDDDLELREVTGGFDMRTIEESSPTRWIALVQERDSDQFARLTIDVADAEPHLIIGLDLRAVAAPAGFSLPHLGEGELLAQLKQRLDHQAVADRFAGAVLVARDGAVMYAEAYGLADRERKVGNRLETRFRIGSMNKMFTATAVLQLVQAGKVALDDPLGAHLSDLANREIARTVTIRHLLTHTGGTGDIFGPEFDAHRLELRRLADYVELYGGRAPEHQPGSRWAYSNYGYILLGLVIERASGEDYYDYVDQHVYRTCGMTSSGSLPEEQEISDRSVGYTKMSGSGPWRPNRDTLPYRGSPAGGGYSTVHDLLRFARALQSHVLLDAEHTELMTTGKVDTPGGRYAFGFGDRTLNGTRCFGHNGAAAGMSGDLKICRDSGYVVAVLANIDPPAANRISDFIVNRLPLPV